LPGISFARCISGRADAIATRSIVNYVARQGGFVTAQKWIRGSCLCRVYRGAVRVPCVEDLLHPAVL
jgi:hypothetical protein